MNQGYIEQHGSPVSGGRRGYTPADLPPGLPWWYYGPPAAPVQQPPPVPAPAAPGHIPKLAYSVDEAAEALGVSRASVYQLIHRKDFPSVKLRGRRLISAELLAEWVRAQAGGGGP